MFYGISTLVSYLMSKPVYIVLYRGKKEIHSEIELTIY